MTPFADVAETHSGVVFFVGDRAYKLKKPLHFGFLDYTTRPTRERICHREVELNKRLAPDVYLGVADLVGPDGDLQDHLVVMRRLPADRRLSSLVAKNDPTVREQLRRVARRLASFHSEAATSPDIRRAATSRAMLSRWAANADDISRLNRSSLASADVARVLELAARYLEGRSRLFDARVAAGKAHDGHGDLLADDIFCLDDGPRILDCIEFDDSLRYGDVLSDVAFLAMDIERLGRPDLAGWFLGSYREQTADTWPDSLQHHHVAYRAFVRAKVAALRAIQEDKDDAPEPTGLLNMTLEHLNRGRIRLIVVGGLPGSGKSTLASMIADELGAALLSSDELRKQQAGLDVTASASAGYQEGLYRPEVTQATYDQLLGRASVALGDGFSVVIDASFGDPAARDRARKIADSAAADLDQVRCVAPMRVIEQRIVERALKPHHPSDASVSVARAMHAEQAPWPGALEVDTARPVDDVADDVFNRLRIGPTS